jgi:hypothetical protein
MGNHMVARNIDGGRGHEFPQGLLRPVHSFGKRRTSHTDADVLNVLHPDTCDITGAADHGLQVLAGIFPAHTRQLARYARGLPQ